MHNSRGSRLPYDRDPYLPLEEAREGWQDFITDEFVQGFELRDGDHLPKFSYLEDYMAGRLWLEALLWVEILGHEKKFIAIIENANVSEVTEYGQPKYQRDTPGALPGYTHYSTAASDAILETISSTASAPRSSPDRSLTLAASASASLSPMTSM